MFYALLIIVAVAVIFTFFMTNSVKESFENGNTCDAVDFKLDVGPDNKYNLKITNPAEEQPTFRVFDTEDELKEYFSGLLTDESFKECETRINNIINDVKSIMSSKKVTVDESLLKTLMDKVSSIEGYIIEQKENKEALAATEALKTAITTGQTEPVKKNAEQAIQDIEVTQQQQLKLRKQLLEKENMEVLAKLTLSEQQLEAQKNRIIELKNSIAVSESELEYAKRSIAYNKNRSKEDSVYVLNQYVSALTRRIIELGLEVTQYKMSKCEICPLFTANNPVTLADVEKLGLGVGSIVTDKYA